MGEEFKPDPEYYKKLTYSTIWKKHKEEVAKLKAKLELTLPVLQGAITLGHGSDTDQWIKAPPTQRSEGDLNLHKDYRKFTSIEVSGTDKRAVIGDVWIRPDKLRFAQEQEAQGIKYWFYMVYPNATYVYSTEDIEPFKDNIIWVKPKGVPEDYISVPCNVAKTEDQMFQWIAQQLV